MKSPFGKGRIANFKQAFTSKEAFIEYAEAEKPDGERHNRWTNIDLAQSPLRDRIWDKYVYLAFWVSYAAGVGNWTAGSSLIALGLYPLDTWLALATAHLLITVMIVANGRGPARYHIGFPIMARSTYGMWGSYLAVGMRAIVCVIWNGVNSYYGGRLVSVALKCIWPAWGRVPNGLPASADITTQQLVGFFIFMFFFFALSFVHSRDLKYLYYFKSIFVSLAMHAVLIWWMVNNKGVSFTSLARTEPLEKQTHVWLVIQAFNAGLGTAASLAINQGDMARYSTTPNSQLWTTLIGYPIASALPCLYGILVAAAAKEMTGTAIWNMWDTLDYMLDHHPDNLGHRFFVFLCAISMAIAYLALNLAANCMPFGSDLSALFPRWMTIRRGQVLCAGLSVVIVPWKLVNSAKSFINFISGYGYFLAPIAACLTVDYYWVKKGNLVLDDLWREGATTRYWYWKGWNMRAVVVTIISLIPCIPSFGATIAPDRLGMSIQAQRMFHLSFVMTYAIAAALYAGSYMIWPEKGLIRPEKSLRFEEMADEFDADEARALATSEVEEGKLEEEYEGKGKDDLPVVSVLEVR